MDLTVIYFITKYPLLFETSPRYDHNAMIIYVVLQRTYDRRCGRRCIRIALSDGSLYYSSANISMDPGLQVEKTQ